MEDGLRGFVPLRRERAERRPVRELQDEDVRVFARARNLVERRISDDRLPLHHLIEDLKRHLGERLVVRGPFARQGLEIAEVIHVTRLCLASEWGGEREKTDEGRKCAAHRALLSRGRRTWRAVFAFDRPPPRPRPPPGTDRSALSPVAQIESIATVKKIDRPGSQAVPQGPSHAHHWRVARNPWPTG